MHRTINRCVATIHFEDLQEFENMGVFPILSSESSSTDYITMNTALNEDMLTVTEISEGGSVPELKVINKSEVPVFLLSGEELSGAKQNRIINASILLREKSETIIPVSCTEQGRWSYTSDAFYDSGIMMSRDIRSRKDEAVRRSLHRMNRFASDQSEIWNDISNMSAKEGVHSPTGSMKDVFTQKMKDLNSYMEAYPSVPNQKGMLVLINNRVAGFDLISRESAYAELHPKLIKSYAMDALLQRQNNSANGNPAFDKAVSFLERAQKCNEKDYDSVGYGRDYRYNGNAMTGSALLHKDEVIHMSFFSIDESDKAGSMSSFSRRRQYRP